MEIEGVVHNGVVVPDDRSALPEGTRVRIIAAPTPPQPRDEWERRLLALAKDCGVSLADSALRRESLYE
jgi:hypothetical protein